MAFDREAAKAAGYTDEEINAYLQDKPELKEAGPIAPGEENNVGEPPPPTTTVTPAGEGNYASTAATAALAVPAALHALPAVPAAGIGAAAVLGGQKIARLLKQYMNPPVGTERNPIGAQSVKKPVTSVAPTGGVNIPVTAPQAPTAPQGQQFLQQQAAMKPMTAAPTASVVDSTTQMVRKLALSKLLPAMQIGAGTFYTSPEEVAIMKEAEARKRAQGWKPLNER